MRKYTWMSLLCFVMTWSGFIQAQSAHTKLKVDVPFDFKVGDKTLPAGEYLVVEPMQHYVQLRDAWGHVVASALTNGVELSLAAPNSKLRFYVSGGQHILEEVWQEGETHGEQLRQSKVEHETVGEKIPPMADASEGRQP